MSFSTGIPGNVDSEAELAPLRAKWGWIVALGLVYLIAGVIALGSVVTATVVSVFVVGVMMVVAGIGEVVGAFQVKSWGKFILWLLIGLLYIVAGFVTFQNPILAAVMLTFILGISLLVSGIMRIIVALSIRREQSWIGVAISGVLTIILGLMILARWPVSSVYILGIFLGVDLVVAGVGWIGLGFGLRNAKA